MSTYLATADSLEYKAVNKEIPIKVQHGLHDPDSFPSILAVKLWPA